MADFTAARFTVDSTLELVADQFEVQMPDSAMFRAASPDDRLSLGAGLLDPTDAPLTITAIRDGVVDEYEVVITPTDVTSTVRGRDPSAALLDGYVDLAFPSNLETAAVGQVLREQVSSFDASLVFAAGRAGRYRASEVARQVCEAVGLSLQWEVRDYELATTFQASGRAIDVLRRLVEPWTLVEPFRADIYLQGTTVVIRHRQLPGQPLVAPPENVFTLAAARRSQLVVRKRRFKKLGTVTLRGRAQPQGLGAGVTTVTNDGTGGGGGGQQTLEYVNEAFDATGQLTERTVVQDTYRTPDRLLLRSIKSVYTQGGSGIQLTSRETIENRWEPSLYDETGPINTPKQLAQAIYREILDPEDGIFRGDASEETTYSYDELGFLTGQATTTRQFNKKTKQMDLSTLVVRTVHDVGPLFTEQITETYQYDAKNLRWTLISRVTAIGGGHRPGGPGRAGVPAGLAKGGGEQAFAHVTVERTFSTDPDAAPVEYENEHLTEADLQFIMDQFAAAQGLYEYELQFDGVAMPWLRRGAVVQFVGVTVEDQLPLPLPPVLLTHVTAEYHEGGPQPAYTLRCRAFGWATT